jgi:hypothetical protein
LGLWQITSLPQSHDLNAWTKEQYHALRQNYPRAGYRQKRRKSRNCPLTSGLKSHLPCPKTVGASKRENWRITTLRKEFACQSIVRDKPEESKKVQKSDALAFIFLGSSQQLE